MSDRVLLDTNIVSYMFNKHSFLEHYARHLENKEKCLSFITVEEMLHGAYLRNWGNCRLLELMDHLDQFDWIYPTFSAVKISAWLRAKKRDQVLDFPDAWIAATAIVEGIPLVSHNAKHFQNIPGLTLISER